MRLPELVGWRRAHPCLTPISYTSIGVAKVSEHGILEVEAMLSPPNVFCLLSIP